MNVPKVDEIQWQLTGEDEGFYRVTYYDENGDYRAEDRDLYHAGEHRLGTVHEAENDVVFCAKCQEQFFAKSEYGLRQAFGYFYEFPTCAMSRVRRGTETFK